jgi:hypothetical protein
MIYTSEQIEAEVSRCRGTWVKRRNLRARLKNESNTEVKKKINEVKGKIRDLRAMAAKESTLRFWYAELTKYELMILE